jgi:hypothetical protein
MKIERGFQRGGFRYQLTIQSLDVTSHSIMSDNAHLFEQLTDATRDRAEAALAALVETGVLKSESAIPIRSSGELAGTGLSQSSVFRTGEPKK